MTVVPVATDSVKEMRMGKLKKHCVLQIFALVVVCLSMNFGSILQTDLIKSCFSEVQNVVFVQVVAETCYFGHQNAVCGLSYWTGLS